MLIRKQICVIFQVSNLVLHEAVIELTIDALSNRRHHSRVRYKSPSFFIISIDGKSQIGLRLVC